MRPRLSPLPALLALVAALALLGSPPALAAGDAGPGAAYDDHSTPGAMGDDTIYLDPALPERDALEAGHSGDAHVRLAYDDGGTPSQPGDDTVRAEQNVDTVGLHVPDPSGSSLAFATLDLRGIAVRHPLFRLVRAADDAALDPLAAPVDAEADERGLDAGYRLPVRNGERAAGQEPLPWPREGWYGLPFRADEDEVGLAPRVLDSSDRLLEQGEATGSYACEGLRDQGPARRLAPPEACPRFAAAAEAVLPNVALRSEFQRLQLLLEGAEGAASAAAARAGEALVESPGGERGSAPAARGADEAFLVAEAPLPLDHLGLRGRGAGGADAPAASAAGAAAQGRGEGLFAALALAGLGLLALGVPLYRRIARARLLQNGARARILGLVRASPGIHESAVARELAMGHTLVQYHVRMLAEFGVLEVRRVRGRKCLFAAGQVGRAAKAFAAMERGASGRVLALVAQQSGIAQRELARALGIRETSVKWHLDRLAEEGLVVVERGPAGKRARLSPDAERARGAAPEALAPAGPAAQGAPPLPAPA